MDRNLVDKRIQSFFQIMQSMDKLYGEYAGQNNLTYISFYILELLYSENECTQKEISELTLYPKQTVNMVIQSFLKKGWVELKQAEDDKRTKHVTLTAFGKTEAEKIIEPFWAAGSAAFSELNDSESEIMLNTLLAFSHSLREKVKNL